MMTDEERAIAKRRAGAFVDAAIRSEMHARHNAESAILLAVSGSLHDMARYAFLAEQHDEARSRVVGWMNHEDAL